MYLKESALATTWVALLFLLAGYATGGIIFYIAFILSLSYLLADYIRLRSMCADCRKISVRKSLSRSDLPPGLSTVMTTRLEYTGKSTLAARISQPLDRSMRLDPGTRPVKLTPGSGATLVSNITPSRYGEFEIGPMMAVVESRLFRSVLHLGGAKKISVRVALGASLVRPSTVLRGTSKYSDIFESMAGQSGGSDFSSMRHYAAGDSAKHIDWAISGKAGSLIVRQYEEERTLPVCFLIDADASMGLGKKTELESAVGLAATLIDRLLIDNQRVGLACFSRSEVISYERMGMGRDHVANMKVILSSIKPVASSGTDQQLAVSGLPSVQQLRQVGREFDDTGLLGTVIGETLKGYMANIKHDGFSRAILKVSQSTTSACHIVVMTNLSMGLTSLLNGIRIANYYGHRVSVVFTPHIWHEDKELIDVGRYYEEYMSVKDTILKLRGSRVKVIDLSSMDKPEEIIYASRIKGRQTGIRG